MRSSPSNRNPRRTLAWEKEINRGEESCAWGASVISLAHRIHHAVIHLAPETFITFLQRQLAIMAWNTLATTDITAEILPDEVTVLLAAKTMWKTNAPGNSATPFGGVSHTSGTSGATKK